MCVCVCGGSEGPGAHVGGNCVPRSSVQEEGDISRGARLSPGFACSTTALCWPSRGLWGSMMGTPHRMLPALASSSGSALGTRRKMQGEEGVAPRMGWTELARGEMKWLAEGTTQALAWGNCLGQH